MEPFEFCKVAALSDLVLIFSFLAALNGYIVFIFFFLVALNDSLVSLFFSLQTVFELLSQLVEVVIRHPLVCFEGFQLLYRHF